MSGGGEENHKISKNGKKHKQVNLHIQFEKD